jgi:hypothetical protein
MKDKISLVELMAVLFWPVMMIIMLLLGASLSGCCFSDAGTEPQNWDLDIDFFPND